MSDEYKDIYDDKKCDGECRWGCKGLSNDECIEKLDIIEDYDRVLALMNSSTKLLRFVKNICNTSDNSVPKKEKLERIMKLMNGDKDEWS